ncbi:MAG TPA: CvpA family protein [Rhodothermales bacterium]|nr:CvpA family protein [Rhodothermales bacterium]
MTTFDLIVLVLLAGGFLSGWRTGAIRQVAGVVGFLVALWLAVRTMQPVGAMLEPSLGVSPRVAPLAGFVIVFVGVQVAIFAVARALEGVAKATKLTPVNRAGGGALGALRTALVVSAVLVPLRFVGVPRAETRERSVLYTPVSEVMPRFWNAMRGQAPTLSDRFRNAIGRAAADSTAADSSRAH